ncbi:MAG: SMP-30/gluconolactonase/LRE family protein [Gammaproteobacteria bacterium]|nr:SMP-30/gluconolactonase/LRE family protein [Gammaproteobacteria bacterium]NNC97225.1 SMP-30/gluconolactonase/LRE family protein [Gammaproteobacteria bacterium]NNM13384.1 SMP-30/gluconolactonase/LRE family protein [Gammaproteobacteria bacterium]
MKVLFKLLIGLLGLFAFLLLSLYFLGSSRVSPVAWEPAPLPGLKGDFAPNEKLRKAKHILKNIGIGPEDITRGSDGFFFTGLEDGRIVRFKPDGIYEEFVNTGGRPLGMHFDRVGNLIVADADKGLLSISPNKTITVLTDSVAGEKMIFVDDLDIASDGTIWFSDASTIFNFQTTFYNFIEGSHTGRLLSYSPATQKTTVHMDNLFFANGVALSANEEFVLVNETGTGRIHRLWLKGNKKGTKDQFHPGLAGNPDNISFNGKDTFWVALPAVRMKINDAMADKPFVRTILAGLPLSWIQADTHYGFIVGLDMQGNVTHNFQDPDGKCSSITSVNQFGNTLYLGSLNMQAACTLELN